MLRKSTLKRADLLKYLADPTMKSLGGLPILAETELTASEAAIQIHLPRFGDVIRLAIDQLGLHTICEFAYELATLFSQFYNECKVVEVDQATNKPTGIRVDRLLLAEAVGDILLATFGILGLRPIDKM